MVKPVSDGYDAWYIDQVLNICLARWLNPAIVPQMCRRWSRNASASAIGRC